MIFFCQQITCLSKDFHSPNADEIELVNPAAAEHIIIDLLYAFSLALSHSFSILVMKYDSIKLSSLVF